MAVRGNPKRWTRFLIGREPHAGPMDGKVPLLTSFLPSTRKTLCGYDRTPLSPVDQQRRKVPAVDGCVPFLVCHNTLLCGIKPS